MNLIPILALATIGTVLGFGWHNQPARPQPGVDGDESAVSQVGHVNWGMVAIWSFVFLSFAALFLAGCTWTKCITGILH